VRLLEMHTLKPLDKEAIIKAGIETGAIVTVEEHRCIGGLASAVSEVLIKNIPIPMEYIAIEDKFTESALPDELREKYGLTTENIVKKTKRVIERKNN
jgi:transketolase